MTDLNKRQRTVKLPDSLNYLNTTSNILTLSFNYLNIGTGNSFYQYLKGRSMSQNIHVFIDCFPKIKNQFIWNHYWNFIKKHLNDEFKEDEYTEVHHICPKCYLNKKDYNNKDNLIKLSGRNHFIAHRILWLALKGKMSVAFRRMMQSKQNGNEEWLPAKEYEKLKRDFSVEHSKTMLNKSSNLIWVYREEGDKIIYKRIKNTKPIPNGFTIGKKENKVSYYNPNKSGYIMLLPGEPIPEGYIRGKNTKSCIGKRCVTNGCENKFMNLNDAVEFIKNNNSWRFGSTEKNHAHAKTCLNKVCLTDGKINKRIKIEDVNNFLLNNPTFHKGMTIHNKFNGVSHTKDTVIVNDGFQQKQIKKSELDVFLLEHPNFKRGLIKGYSSGKIYVTNEICTKQIFPSQLEQFLLDNPGWRKGSSLNKGKTPCLNRISLTNGTFNRKIKPEEYEQFMIDHPDWRKGITRFKKNDRK